MGSGRAITTKVAPKEESGGRLKAGLPRAKRVLVVGGAGYLGSVLVGHLLRCGFSARVLDTLWFNRWSLEEFRFSPNFDVVHGDLRDPETLARCMRDCDAVIHLAAVVGDAACEENQSLAVDVNLGGTSLLLQMARNCGVRRFIFASTCSVYGASEQCLDEDSPLNPLSLYARTKVLSERIVLGAQSCGFFPTVFRLGTLFGLSPRMRLDLVINLFVAQAITSGRITIWNGEQWRPFLHVQDAARAFVPCLEASTSTVSGQIFNVGADRLNLRIDTLGKEIASFIPNTRVNTLDTKDQRNYRVSFDKIRRTLRYECERDLAFGINEICRWTESRTATELSAEQFNNQSAMRLIEASASRLCPIARELHPIGHEANQIPPP